MLNPKVSLTQNSSSKSLLFLQHNKPFNHGNGQLHLPNNNVVSKPFFSKTQRKLSVKAMASSFTQQPPKQQQQQKSSSSSSGKVKVKATVIVNRTAGGGLDHLVNSLAGKSLLLELVSAELDPQTGKEKQTIKGSAEKKDELESEIVYEAEFEVPSSFGKIGAIYVQNELNKEMFIKNITLNGFLGGSINLACNSWVQPKSTNEPKRIFFTNKLYLPSQTPDGLKRLREEELQSLRGNGAGERKKGERIYDYDFYNDLGDPDKDAATKRPVLGGEEHPYPRRGRTGRPKSKTDPLSEPNSSSLYLPRDEEFSEVKESSFTLKNIYSSLNALRSVIETFADPNLAFEDFSDIDELFKEGISLAPIRGGNLNNVLFSIVKAFDNKEDSFLRFDKPDAMEKDRFFWLKDEEFARETLAGVNPLSIQLVTEWPLKSKLDPAVYGPPDSKITTELINEEIKQYNYGTVEEVIKQKKLFMLDYHDLLLPYVSKVRNLGNTTMYASRTLFILTQEEQLQPLCIELTRPPMAGKPQWKQVYKPTAHSTSSWLWKLAKLHVLAHDSAHHQLVSHFLRTHACIEPFIIAAHRQLSVMHPVFRLLHPHFRYTMEINARARGLLINSNGVIESSFSPGKYSMEISSVAYDKLWRFDEQSLPKDLISRGMAVEDPSAPHGLKLTIKDYPFANDGLIIWDAMKQWVTEYINHYYPDPSLISTDSELQSFWTEVRTVGHGDKKNEPWWPELKTAEDLIEVLTTIAWVASAHHAAVNFGQYTYGGYFPNRPTNARKIMPNEEDSNSEERWKNFLENPENLLLQTFPSQLQATKVIVVLDLLSSHSPDEEYLGQVVESAWNENPVIKAAFEKFSAIMKNLEAEIDARNGNESLKNRHGAGIVPYELMKPLSGPGVTSKGVPYSTSI